MTLAQDSDVALSFYSPRRYNDSSFAEAFEVLNANESDTFEECVPCFEGADCETVSGKEFRLPRNRTSKSEALSERRLQQLQDQVDLAAPDGNYLASQTSYWQNPDLFFNHDGLPLTPDIYLSLQFENCFSDACLVCQYLAIGTCTLRPRLPQPHAHGTQFTHALPFL